MAIGAIGGSSPNMYTTRIQTQKQQESKVEETRREREEAQEKLTSGKKINSAADDAAGLAIAQNILSSYVGIDMQNQNLSMEMDRINVGDSALSGVADSLNRIQELSVQASNGTLSSSEREIIQGEIDYIKEGISDSLSNGEFNAQSLFGSGENQLGEISLESLGIADFDVTGDFSLDTIDQALDQVASLQSELGAKTNGMQHQYNSNAVTSENLKATASRIQDTDYAEEIMNLNTKNALSQYQMQVQKNMMNLISGTSFNIAL